MNGVKLRDLDRIGMQCEKCLTEMIYEAASPLTIVVPAQCPSCGAVYPDQGACVNAYRKLFQGSCSTILRLYPKA